jgi:hypothetical protein
MKHCFQNGRLRAKREIQNAITAQQIGKILSNAGLKKIGTRRENFQTSVVGDYEVRHLRLYGLDAITVNPSYMSGTNALPKIKAALQQQGIEFEEKNGTLVIKDNQK